jgi:hypothetical protein
MLHPHDSHDLIFAALSPDFLAGWSLAGWFKKLNLNIR